MTLAQLNSENNNTVDIKSLNLKITDYENILNVYQDKKGNWFYNLNAFARLDVDESLFLEYQCIYDCHWPLISYNIYGTTRLAWLLMTLNKVKCDNLFKPILAGDKIKYIDKEYVRTIVTSLQNYNV